MTIEYKKGRPEKAGPRKGLMSYNRYTYGQVVKIMIILQGISCR